MNKDAMYKEIHRKYEALTRSLEGDDIDLIKSLTLEVHALTHPAEVSGREEPTIADLVMDYMLSGHQADPIPREPWEADLHYAGTNTVPLCWQIWHTYRIEDLVSNILMANGNQIFNSQWKSRMNAPITDTGNALETGKALEFGRCLDVRALREYAIAVGKNTRAIVEKLTLEEVRSLAPEEWVMRIYEEGGVTSDLRSVWLLVFWGRLTRGGMILTPLTNHHMMHLPPALDNLPIMG